MGSAGRAVRLGAASVRVPAEHAQELAGGEGAIDSPVRSWRSRDLRLLLDSGPFADPLDAYEGRPGSGRSHETIAGRPARLVWFDRPDGVRVVAVHLAAGDGEALTLVVEGPAEIDRDVLVAIARSLTID